MAAKVLSVLSHHVVSTCYSVILRDSVQASRALVCHQQSRGRRRTCKPPGWFVKRQARSVDQMLTDENKDFIKQAAVEHYMNKPSPLKQEPVQRNTWTPRTRRTGVLALKLGVIPQWKKDGTKIHTTVLQVLDNHVIRYTNPEQFSTSLGWKPFWKQRYGSVVVGAMSCDPHKFTKEYTQLFEEAGVPPKRRLTRFLVTPDAAIDAGTPLNAMHFRVGQYVDCQAKTIDYGFQGGVKRWGMKGGPRSHGPTKTHRRIGATGSGREKARVWKGKKMPGHMGSDRNIIRGLKIWRINTKFNVLYVHGPAVSGPTHCIVRVYDTILRYRRDEVETPYPMPTFYPGDTEDPLQEEYFDDELYQFTQDSIAYKEEGK